MKERLNVRPQSRDTRRGVLIAVFTIALISIFSSWSYGQKKQRPTVQRVRIVINEQGYSPQNVRLRRGAPTYITFIRQTDRTCGTEIVIPDYGIHRALPLNERVLVSFTPKRSGEITFACSMNMMRGKLIIR